MYMGVWSSLGHEQITKDYVPKADWPSFHFYQQSADIIPILRASPLSAPCLA